MIGLNDVVKNWGDFDTSGTWKANFGGMREGALRGTAIDMVPDAGGAFSASDREPGYGRVSNYARAVVERRGRRYSESRMAEAASIIFRGFNGSKRDLLNLQEAMSISDFPNLFGDVIDRAVL